jgi:hypothetical protein
MTHFSGSTLPLPQPINLGSIKRLPLIPISHLFDYENPAWVKLISEGAEQSKKMELALYDMLNSGFSSNDANDTLFDVDVTVEALLMS